MKTTDHTSLKPGQIVIIYFARTLLAALMAVFVMPSAFAANSTWSATPSTANWNLAANWDTIPVTTSSLIFGTSSTTSLNNDFSGFTFNGITFNSGASTFTIGGNSFTLSGDIANSSSATETINNNMTVTSGNDRHIVFGSSGTLVLGGNIAFNTGGRLYLQTSAGTITLNGANTGGGVNSGNFYNLPYATMGNTIYNSQSGNTIILGNKNAFGNSGSGLMMNANTTLQANTDLSGGNAFVNSIAIGQNSGGRTLTISGGNNLTISGKLYSCGSSSHTLDINNGSATTIISGNVYLSDQTSGTKTFTVQADTAATISGPIADNGAGNAGLGSLIKTGNNALTISGANTYSGGTTISAGTLALSGSGTLGASTGVLSISGGTLDLGGLTSPAAGAVTISGGTIQNGTLTASTSYAANNTGAATVSAILAGSSVALTESGGGTLTLSGPNTYSGGTTISAGILDIQNSSALGNSTGSASVTAGAALQVDGSGLSVANALTLNGTGVSSGGALRNLANNNTCSGAVTLGSDSRINSDGGTLTLNSATAISSAYNLTFGGAGNISISTPIQTGAKTVTKDGNGTLTLSGANTYSGTTTLNQGFLQFNGTSAMSGSSQLSFGTGGGLALRADASSTFTPASIASVTDGNTINFDVGPATSASGQTLTLSGGLTFNSHGGGTINVTGSSSYGLALGALSLVNSSSGGTPTLNINATSAQLTLASISGGNYSSTINFQGGSPITIQGTVANTSNGSVDGYVKGGTTLTLQGASTRSGSNNHIEWHVQSGQLNVNNANALSVNSSGDGYAGLELAGGNLDNTSSGDLTEANNPTVAINSSFTFVGTHSLNLGTGAVTLGNNVTATVSANTLTLGGTISGSYSLNKTGNGTLTLSGANTYSGGTTLNGGTLQVNSTETAGTSGPLGKSAASNPGNISFGGGTLQYSSANHYDYSGRFSTVASQPISIDVNGQSVTFGTALTSSGGSLTLTDSGANGTLSLSAGTHTYSGATTINGGKLVGVVGGSCASSAVSVAATSGKTATLGVSITDNTKQWSCSSLTVNNAGTSSILDFNFGTVVPSTSLAPLKVTGAAAFTTTPTVTVEVGNNNSLLSTGTQYPLMTWGSTSGTAPTAVTVTGGSRAITGHLTTSGSTLYLVLDSTGEPLRWITSPVGTWDTSTSNWKDSSGTVTAYSDTATADQVVFDDTYISADTTVTLSTTVNPSSVTANNSTYNYTNSGSGAIAGSTGLTKSGTKTLSLNTPNTFTGNVTVNGGTLAAAKGGNGFPSSASALGNATTAGRTCTINGSTVSFTAGNVLANGNDTIVPGLSFIVNSGGTLQTAANDANVFGNITLNGGTFTTGNGFSSSYQAAIMLGSFTVGGSTASTINTAGSANNSIMLGGAVSGVNTTTFNVADATGNANADLTVSAKLTDSATLGTHVGALVKSGLGTMILSGANSYSGGTTISAGTLQIGDYSSALKGSELGSGTVTLGASTTLQLASSGDASVINFTPSFVLNGGTLASSDGLNHLGTGAGATISVNSPTILQRQWGHVTSKYLALDGILQGSAALTLQGYGGNATEGSTIWINNANNTYSGTITVNANTGAVGFGLVDGANNALQTATVNLQGNPTGADTGSPKLQYGVNFAAGVTAPALAGLSGTGNIALQDLSSTPLPVSLTVGASAGTFSGILSGAGSLTKAGAGTLTLANANTYTGNTTISAGTLALGSSGSINSSATISLSAGATFDVSAISAYLLSSSTALSAAGAASAATIIGASGGTVNLGSRPIALTYDGSHPALTISQGALSLTGNAFTLNGTALSSGTYAIVQQTSGNITASGTFTVSGTAIDSMHYGTVSVSGGNVNLTVALKPTVTGKSYSRAPGTAVKIYASDLAATATVDSLLSYTATFDHCASTTANSVTLGNNGQSGNSAIMVYPGNAANSDDSFSYTVNDGHGGTVSGTVSITINNNVTGQATINLVGQAATLGFFGIPGYHYIVQRSVDGLNNWQDLTSVTTSDVTPSGTSVSSGVVTAPSGGSFTVTDPSPPSNPASVYYQLRATP